MRLFERMMNARFGRKAARWMAWVCWLTVGACCVLLVLSAIGRVQFSLQTDAGDYERAIWAEDAHGSGAQSLTFSLPDSVRVRDADGEIHWATKAALCLMSAAQIVPLAWAYAKLGRMFANIARGEIFTDQNAACLFWFGLMQVFMALATPFLKLAIAALSNLIADSALTISTGQQMLSQLFPGVAILVAAWMFRCGVHLQDEVDHTL